jgi:anti-anti-sigma regulatory factor
VLRLTVVPTPVLVVTLKVEGQIVGEWAGALERECSALVAGGARVLLDLSGVIYIDSDGVATLRSLPAGEIVVINCTPIIQGLLADGE